MNFILFDDKLLMLINISPLQGLDPGRTRFYKHTVPTELKRLLRSEKFVAKVGSVT